MSLKPLPLIGKTPRKGAFDVDNDAASAHIDELLAEVHALEHQNRFLRLREKMLCGVAVASRQAVAILRTYIGAPGMLEGDKMAQAKLEAIGALEAEASALSRGCPALAEAEAALALFRPATRLGSAKYILLDAMDLIKIYGPVSEAMLGGLPLSMLHAQLFAIQHDPQLLQRSVLLKPARPVNAQEAEDRPLYTQMHQDLAEMLQQWQGQEPPPSAVAELGATVMSSCLNIVIQLLLWPHVEMQSGSEEPNTAFIDQVRNGVSWWLLFT
jgi:hypothetical protein